MSRITDRTDALKIIKELDTNKKDYFVIHYSCESFFGLKGKSPRITSIAVKNLEYGQAELFAIYKTAEKMKINFDKIEQNYPEIEQAMLNDFFEFAKVNQQKKWLHWNMRDSIFGFKAIEHRYQVLSTKDLPFRIPDEKQINIADLFKRLYGPEYIDDPKMDKLMKKNNLNPRNYLNGQEEAEAFTKAEYYELSMSSVAKVRMFSQMINLAIDNSLLTNVSNFKLYGTSLKAKWYALKEKPYFIPISWLVTTILGGVIGHFISKGLG